MSESNKTKIFISYRRSDSPDTVKLIYERLKKELPRWDVFYDHRSIPLGEDFPGCLRHEITSADVVLVIIGPSWLEILKKRKDQPGIDHVREEVRLAIESGHTVIPVLVANAKNLSGSDLADFPELKTLATLNSKPIRPEPDLDHDIGGLVTFLEHIGPSEGAGSILGGKYKLVRILGQGGMGIVWLAKQLQPKRSVAVKLIKLGMDSKEILARFDAERQALAVLDHPNIAKVFDGGTATSGRPFFAMEYVKGIPITEYCDNNKLSPDKRLALFVQACEAVQHAHQKGIIHRDLKPGNVLVEAVQEKPVCKVIDFGLAKALGHKLTDLTLHTAFNAFVGTLEYSSPEQAAGGATDVDTRTDIYSLGALLYELLAGEPPFNRDELLKAGELGMRRVVQEQDPLRPSTKLSSSSSLPAIALRRHLDPKKLTALLRGDLDWIVMKALEKDRNRRYESVNGFARDVARYLGQEPVEARPPSTAYRLQKLYQRNRSAVTAAVALVIAIVLGLVGTIWFAIDAGGARRQAVARQREAELALQREREVSLELVQLSEKLADNYLNAGDRKKALPLFQKALGKSEQILGPESPSTLEQMHSVAFLLGLDGRVEEALPIQKKVMDATMRVLGPESPETHSAISNLAALHLRLGQVPTAVELFKQAYELRSAHLDKDDFNLRVSLRWMVITYSMTERWKDALPIAVQWVEHLERVNEAESPEFAWATASLAAIQCGMKNYDQANFYAQRVAKLPGTKPADQSRANNILARCQMHKEVALDKLSDETVNQLVDSYVALKGMLADLPGFKQFFVTNACKRNMDAFMEVRDQQQVRVWQHELLEIEASIRENRKPLSEGIPTFDPETGTETERFAPSIKNGSGPTTKDALAEDN